jgi:hypothetical protein
MSMPAAGLKPFQPLPANCTSFVGDSQQIRTELTNAIAEMKEYHTSHPSDTAVYQNCWDELTEIKTLMTPTTAKGRMFPMGKLLFLVTRHDGKIQAVAIASKLSDSAAIDQASVAPWNIVRPAVNEPGTPTPFQGAGWQMVSVALAYRGKVGLTAATNESADSFNKMGFRTSSGELLKGGGAGTLEGQKAEEFRQKMASRS